MSSGYSFAVARRRSKPSRYAISERAQSYRLYIESRLLSTLRGNDITGQRSAEPLLPAKLVLVPGKTRPPPLRTVGGIHRLHRGKLSASRTHLPAPGDCTNSNQCYCGKVLLKMRYSKWVESLRAGPRQQDDRGVHKSHLCPLQVR